MRHLTTAIVLAISTATLAAIPSTPLPGLDPPTLASPASTGTTITVRVCAGGTGAPAGFSVQWLTEAEYTVNGWFEPAVASFSGSTNSLFSLSPGECLDVVIGALDASEPGVSFTPGAGGPLACDTAYAFRAFAHNDGTGRSDFTADYIFSTSSDCDADADDDGVLDEVDSCLATEPGAPVNAQGCAIAQLCPCGDSWKSHGAYLACVAETAEDFRSIGVIVDDQASAIISKAGSSSCGKRP
jgi:hypothetical protein